MKKRITLVLMVAFIVATALALHSAEKEKVRRIRHIEIRRTTGNETMMPEGLLKLFKTADKLELTNPQLLQLRMLYQKNADLAQKHKETAKLGKKLCDPNLKEEDVKKYASEQAKSLEARILAKYQLQQEFRKVLTPEQLKKLAGLKFDKAGRKGPPFMKGGKMGPPMMPFWNKPGKDRKSPHAMRFQQMLEKKRAKLRSEKQFKRQVKDSPEAVIDEMESILDDVDSGE